MKLQFKVQEYQTAAVHAVVDCFRAVHRQPFADKRSETDAAPERAGRIVIEAGATFCAPPNGVNYPQRGKHASRNVGWRARADVRPGAAGSGVFQLRDEFFQAFRLRADLLHGFRGPAHGVAGGLGKALDFGKQ